MAERPSRFFVVMPTSVTSNLGELILKLGICHPVISLHYHFSPALVCPTKLL